MKKRIEKRRHTSARFLFVAIFFSVICLAFLIVMGVYQIRGSLLPPKEEGTIKTYTVPGLRGEIYDRNGKRIVGNATRYDLIYEYGAMPETRREINDSLLATLEALSDTGNGDKLADDYFILEGTYPEMHFVAEVRDKESNEFYHYKKFLSRQEMTREETDASDVAEYFVKRYGLSTSRYTKSEITSLIRLYYEMERVGFGQYQSYTIAKGINRKLLTRLEESNIEGVNFDIQAERVYEYPGVASHILGRLGKITAENAEQYIALGYPLDALVGIDGCEAAFENYLRGQDGVMVIRYDKNGNQIEKYYEVEPTNGNDVYLTIDIDLQIAAEERLKESVDGIETSKGGAITAIDPTTGEVLALVSYPTYDLSQLVNEEYVKSLNDHSGNPWLNRALDGTYAPGSTYKVGAALAGLETNPALKLDTGSFDAQTNFDCTHVLYHPNYTSHPECTGTHGPINVVEAIRVSCNIFFYHLGDLLGVEGMTSYTTRLGLGADPGLELRSATGSVAKTDPKEPGETLNAAIGQGQHAYTPLQLSVYMSSVVNGGTRYRAQILGSVKKYYTGEVVYTSSAEALDQVEFSTETYNTLMDGMQQVTDGISEFSSLEALGITVGGKTGTAQVQGKGDNALFSGFAMTEGQQKIVISCVIEEVKAGQGGTTAAKTVARVLQEYFEKQANNS